MGSHSQDMMVGHHLLLAALAVATFITDPGVSQGSAGCEPCVTVDPLSDQGPDEWAGYYTFKEVTDNCPNKCSYIRSDSPGTIYCFGSGPRTGEYKCPLTDPTKDMSGNPTSSITTVENQAALTTGKDEGTTTGVSGGDSSSTFNAEASTTA